MFLIRYATVNTESYHSCLIKDYIARLSKMKNMWYESQNNKHSAASLLGTPKNKADVHNSYNIVCFREVLI